MTPFRLLLSMASVAPALGAGITLASAEAETRKCKGRGDEIRDCRDRFEMTVYAGQAIDTFTADAVDDFLNPSASGEVKSRYVAGFDFAYRLAGSPAPRSDASFWEQGQLWIYGETVHGVRSSDVDCQSTDVTEAAPVCRPFADPNGVLSKTKFILRNARTLEGFGGLRWEFFRLPVDAQGFGASLFLKAEAGFLAVDEQPDDLIDMHQIALGLVLTGSSFVGSHLQIGHGQTDLFEENATDRWKIDGLGSYILGKGVAVFAQIVMDVDLDDGSDSIQTYYGLDVDPETLFRIRGSGGGQ